MSFAVAGLFFFLIMAFLGWMYQHIGVVGADDHVRAGHDCVHYPPE